MIPNPESNTSEKPGRGALSFIGFVLLAAVLLLFLSALTKPTRDSDFSAMRDQVDQLILTQKDNTVDVVILGDSEAITNLAPLLLWELEGIAALNLGSVEQYLYRSREYLELLLEYQNPKLVILEADSLYLTDFLKPENYAISFVSHYFPVFRNHDRWKEWALGEGAIPAKAEDQKGREERQQIYQGYNHSTAVIPAVPRDYMTPDGKREPVPDWNRRGVLDLAAFCREKEIPLLLVSTPTIKNWSAARHEGVEELAQENDLVYLDLNTMPETVTIDWTKDTRDKGDHLCYSGAKKVTGYMASYLKEHYSLPDHRGEEGFEKWEEGCEAFEMDRVS